MNRRRAFTIERHSYLPPAEDLEEHDCQDVSALLRLLTEARLRAAERDTPSSENVREQRVLFQMLVAGDELDGDGRPVNEFEHLTGDTRRELEGYRTWLGPAPLASLTRVLTGRIEWSPPVSRDARLVLQDFAAARVIGSDRDVAGMLDRAVARSRYARPGTWRIDGLGMRSRGDEWSVDRLLETNRGQAVLSTPAEPDAHVDADPTLEFAGLYALARERVNDLLFGDTASPPRPQTLPRQPALVLSVAYTIEYLTVSQRSDASVPANLVDQNRREWARLAVPAAQAMDGDAMINATEQLCARTARSHPWMLELLRCWAGWEPDGRPALTTDEVI